MVGAVVVVAAAAAARRASARSVFLHMAIPNEVRSGEGGLVIELENELQPQALVPIAIPTTIAITHHNHNHPPQSPSFTTKRRRRRRVEEADEETSRSVEVA
jgi:hypothetical protein